MLEEIAGLYEAYVDEFHRLERYRRPLEGAFGLGGGPQNYPCHETFARDLEELLGRFAAQAPSSDQVGPALRYVYFTAPDRWKLESAVYWMLLAVQGLTLELIPLLDSTEAEMLYKAYQDAYPRRQRLPVQTKVSAALGGRQK